MLGTEPTFPGSESSHHRLHRPLYDTGRFEKNNFRSSANLMDVLIITHETLRSLMQITWASIIVDLLLQFGHGTKPGVHSGT
jgi:hypothetical protein